MKLTVIFILMLCSISSCITLRNVEPAYFTKTIGTDSTKAELLKLPDVRIRVSVKLGKRGKMLIKGNKETFLEVMDFIRDAE